MGQRVPLVVELADGTELHPVVDQRDFAAAEAADLPGTTASQVTRTRFLAWSALRRAGETKAPWEKFNADLCVSAEIDPEYVGSSASDDDLDPGMPGQSDGA